MNTNWTVAIVALFVVGVGLVAYRASSQAPSELRSNVELPSNSCAISCAVRTTQRPVSGAVTCIIDARPLCQCQDETRPFAGCEPLRRQE